MVASNLSLGQPNGGGVQDTFVDSEDDFSYPNDELMDSVFLQN